MTPTTTPPVTSSRPAASADQIRAEVRAHYGAIARGARPGCCGSPTGSAQLGYSADELGAAPAGADLGLGCGNPQAIAELVAGEVVVDLGAGGGFDCFLAGRAVGPTGRVIGVDMSADMVGLARGNAARQAAGNVEFRLGEIEQLPVADAIADVVISNCVINLSPDKPAVYREAFRVLRPGGRIAISDVVALQAMPAAIADDVAARCGCVAGAAQVDELTALLRATGFTEIAIAIEPASRALIASWAPGQRFEDYVASARITAVRPADSQAARAPGAAPDRAARGVGTATAVPAGRGSAPVGSTGDPAAAPCCKPGCCG